jgi:predicted metal-dependent hydrolase
LSKKTDIPEYKIRVSNRARHARLQVKPFIGLEVVIPKRFPRNQVESFVTRHRGWINEQLDKHASSFEKPSLPEQIHITLTDETFSVEYIDEQELIETDRHLRINRQDAYALLRFWVREKARRELSPRLLELAQQFNFSYQRISIRSQKSRWGSCSTRGTISLNDQLIFLPSETVDYLLIHELCHTRHMNHSSSFWKLVSQCCPDFRKQEAILSRGKEWVPTWFQRSLYQDS